jgi:cytochrome c biogenesis protein CcmG, thiol:disulfide interchange protein DsbE
LPLDNARGSRAVYLPATTLQDVRPRVYWPVTLAAAALVALLTYGVASTGPDTSIDEQLADGERVEAPVKDLPVLGSDATGSLADHAGKVVVLNLWASWCEPCKTEMPLLQRTHERIEPEGGLVLGIDMQDSTERALAFLDEAGIEFQSLRDVDREYARELGVSGYPETFLIDRQGRIAAMRRGPVDKAWLDDHLAPLLEERA